MINIIQHQINEILTKTDQFKACQCCNQIKLKDEFSYGRGMKDGKKAKCKVCSSAYERLSKEEKTELKLQKNKTKNQTYFDEFVKIVQNKGGTCVGTIDDYKNAYSLIDIKCKDGHMWKQSLNNVRKRGCPICQTNNGELVALGACNFLFGKKFRKVKPDWLKNSKNNNLELDIYNHDLNLAVEYNGIQHYKFIPFFHRTEENFQERIIADKIKIDKCKEKGVKLIIIPYTVDTENICEYIYIQAKKLNIAVVNDYTKFDYGGLKNTFSLTDKVSMIVDGKGGKIIGGTCFDNKSSLIIKCKKGHEWVTRVRYIKRGKWCSTCTMTQKHLNIANDKIKIVDEEIYEEMEEKSIEDMSEEEMDDDYEKDILSENIIEDIQEDIQEEAGDDELCDGQEDENIIEENCEGQGDKNIIQVDNDIEDEDDDGQEDENVIEEDENVIEENENVIGDENNANDEEANVIGEKDIGGEEIGDREENIGDSKTKNINYL